MTAKPNTTRKGAPSGALTPSRKPVAASIVLNVLAPIPAIDAIPGDHIVIDLGGEDRPGIVRRFSPDLLNGIVQGDDVELYLAVDAEKHEIDLTASQVRKAVRDTFPVPCRRLEVLR